MVDVSTRTPGAAVVPVLRYRNLPAAIDWLCAAFGFEKHRVTVDSNGAFLFAQLTFGSSLIMISPIRASAFDQLMRQPDEVGGAETQVCYFFVPDARAHCARARAAGARIVFDVEDRANGGHSYSCRDLEGHLWNFGTYNPWHHQAIGHVPPPARRHGSRVWVKRSLLAAGCLAGGMTAIVATAGRLPERQRMPAQVAPIETGSIRANDEPAPTLEPIERSLATYVEAEKAAMMAERELERVQVEMDTLRKRTDEARNQQLQTVSEKDAAKRLAKDLQERLDKASIAKNAAEQAAREARRQLARARAARRIIPEPQTRIQPQMPLWQ